MKGGAYGSFETGTGVGAGGDAADGEVGCVVGVGAGSGAGVLPAIALPASEVPDWSDARIGVASTRKRLAYGNARAQLGSEDALAGCRLPVRVLPRRCVMRNAVAGSARSRWKRRSTRASRSSPVMARLLL